ncbi:hemicentin-2-like [Bacillus rossius redtenbacheri]|uniref:hemicentin-2-like n=1 Tax=Bacillus rossius redtenbacheri TaxID=93214 RepID=UPI002FDE47A6
MVQPLCLLLAAAELLILATNSHSTDGHAPARNSSGALHPDASSYLQELAGYWPYNDSFQLSRFQEFDHTHFDDSREEHAASTEPYPAARPVAEPEFDGAVSTHVTAQLGGPASLRCRVRNLGERPVSWVRRRDWHILTSGALTYTSDERFRAAHAPGSDDWDLRIEYVQKRDNGTYECQVSTGSGTVAHYVHLQVVVPSAFILGSGEYHIGEGSTISLVCVIEHSPSPPQHVLWYHNDQMINYDTSRGGVTVSTEPGPKTHSRLIVNAATRGDSGNYTCRAANTEADTIHVFVSRGDNTAAIQRQESSGSDRGPRLLLPSVLLTCLRLWVARS